MEKRRKRKQLERDGESKLKSSLNPRPKSARTTNGAIDDLKNPYPSHARPTPEECRAVRDALLALHGFPQEFAKYRRKSASDAVKTEKSDEQDDDATGLHADETVLDGLVRTVLSHNTTEANSQRAFASLKSAFPTWEDVCFACFIYLSIRFCMVVSTSFV